MSNLTRVPILTAHWPSLAIAAAALWTLMAWQANVALGQHSLLAEQSAPPGNPSTPNNRTSGSNMSAPIDWHRDAALRQALAQPVVMQFSGEPLRQALGSLARVQRVAVLLDRRIDPSQRFEFASSGESLSAAIAALAESVDAGYSQTSGVAYLGPTATAEKLRTALALNKAVIDRLPAPRRAALMRTARAQWGALAEPRALVEQLAAEAAIEIEAVDQVPHDLWAAADLGMLTWHERLALVVVQFDLLPEIAADGQRVVLRPMPAELAIERDYPAVPAAEVARRRLAGLAPRSELRVEGERVWVRGPIEDHERIQGLGQRQPPAQAGGPGQPPGQAAPPGQQATQLHTLQLENVALRQVLQALRVQLKLELEVDTQAVMAAGTDLGQLISVRVERVSTEELLRAIVGPAGLKAEPLGENRWRIVPAGPQP